MKVFSTVVVVLGLLVVGLIALKVIGWLIGSLLWLAVVLVVAFVAYSVGRASTRPD